MSSSDEFDGPQDTNRAEVPSELVRAALRAAARLGRDVADVPMLAIAQEAGISRSTLLRRLGGTRQALDEAVRAAGVDPGGQRPVRDRAVEAAAHLIGEQGLAAATLEAVAAAAQCSVHSLYATFGSRDELLRAVFDRYSPILDLEETLSGPPADLAETVRRVYRLLADGLARPPRVLPAVLAQALARPNDEGTGILAQHFAPRLLGGLGRWLAAEVAAGRVRDLPLLLLIHQMAGPLVFHFLLRPVSERVPDVVLPSVEEACEVFAETFLRAVALTEPPAGVDGHPLPHREELR
ncbi:TetR/AcrR family transcriptional regulator [Microtetraspora malaysiensis]|uniref:TetR/AcrR family transcriptional regulator n=1 Tax=Microtetraspora malaysiensis TaxID=161358 RepID=UPI003D8FFAD4